MNRKPLQDETNRMSRVSCRKITLWGTALAAIFGATGCNDYAGGTEYAVGEEVATGAEALWGVRWPNVAAGMESDGSPVKICRVARTDGSRHPGKVLKDGACRYGYGGAEIISWDFEGLQIGWASHSSPVKWINAYQFGNEADGTPLYPCKASVAPGAQKLLGKTRPDWNWCAVGINASEQHYTAYDVLQNPSDSFPKLQEANYAGSNVSLFALGNEGDTMPSEIYKICSGEWAGGSHPGWIRPGTNQCHIGYGSEEISVSQFKFIVPSFKAPDGANFWKAGNEASGTSLGVCRAFYPNTSMRQVGKYLSSMGRCNFAYDNSEVSLTSGFQVLRN